MISRIVQAGVRGVLGVNENTEDQERELSPELQLIIANMYNEKKLAKQAVNYPTGYGQNKT